MKEMVINVMGKTISNIDPFYNLPKNFFVIENRLHKN